MTEINPSFPPAYADQLAEFSTPEQADAIARAAAENPPAPAEEPKSYLELPAHDMLVPMEKLKTSDSLRLVAAFSSVMDADNQSEQLNALADFLDGYCDRFILPERLADWEAFAVAKNNHEVLDLLVSYFTEMGNV